MHNQLECLNKNKAFIVTMPSNHLDHENTWRWNRHTHMSMKIEISWSLIKKNLWWNCKNWVYWHKTDSLFNLKLISSFNA